MDFYHFDNEYYINLEQIYDENDDYDSEIDDDTIWFETVYIQNNLDDSESDSEIDSESDSEIDSQLYNELDSQLYNELDSQLYNELDIEFDILSQIIEFNNL